MSSAPHPVPQEEDDAGLQSDVVSPTVYSSTCSVSPSLPEIPASELDLTLSLDSILGGDTSDPETAKVHKRASNVLKLAQENEKLKEELKMMSDRLEAAERKREELLRKSKETAA